MNTLLHNPLTDLSLPSFLLLYAAGTVIGLISGSFWIWLCDGTRDDDLPDESLSPPDPYEVAYLRGGAANVARLVVFDLIEQGKFELVSPRRGFGLFASAKKLRRGPRPGDLSAFTAIQRAAWNWLAQPRFLAHVFHRRTGLSKVIAAPCLTFVKPLTERRLLETRGRRMACKAVGWGLTVSLVGVGLYKYFTSPIIGAGEALSLVVLMVLGQIGTAIICRRVGLSDLGHRYLENISQELGSDNRHDATEESSVRGDIEVESLTHSQQKSTPKSSTSSDAADSSSVFRRRLLRMAVFGAVETHHRDANLFEPHDHERPWGEPVVS
jgi:uncharacterized protein (TIGR04222 family)